MGQAVYSNRYHQSSYTQSQPQEKSGSAAPQASSDTEYVEDGEISSADNKSMSQTQKALSSRYQEVRQKIGNTLEEFEGRMRDLNKAKDLSGEDRLAALEEIEELLGELKSHQTLYNSIESNLSREGMQLDGSDLDYIINRHQTNIDKDQDVLLTQKAEAEAIAQMNKEASEKVKSLVKFVSGDCDYYEEEVRDPFFGSFKKLHNENRSSVSQFGISKEVRGGESVYRNEAETIIRSIASALKSGDWEAVEDRINSMSSHATCLAYAVIQARGGKQVHGSIPPEIYNLIGDKIAKIPEQNEAKLWWNGGSTGIAISGYRTSAYAMADFSVDYQSRMIERQKNKVAREVAKDEAQEEAEAQGGMSELTEEPYPVS